MPAPLRVVEPVAGMPLQDQLRAEAAKGSRVVVALMASWAPPCKALRQALAEPTVAQLLAGCCFVLADVDQHTAELQALGARVMSVPELWAWEPEKGLVGVLSGSAWGRDTVENIQAALARWLPALPPLPKAPAPTGSQKLVAILGVIGALALLVGAAVWQVTSQQKAQREQAEQEMRERIQRDVSESVRKALEKRAPEQPAR
ncbi:MAG: thioredoxin family protein [Myxococcales bacterium]